MKDFSLKIRLIMGLGSMVLPIAIIGTSSVWMVQSSIATFEQNEEDRTELLLPLINLDTSITRVTDFAGELDMAYLSSQEAQSNWEILRFKLLSDLEALQKMPSSLSGQTQLLQSITQDLQKSVNAIDMLLASDVTVNESTLLQTQEKVQLSLMTALEGVRNSYSLLTAWFVKENVRRAENFKERFHWIITCVLLLIISLAILASLILTRSILTPIDQMKKGLDRFSRGELNYRIQVHTRDEMQDLAESMNAMAASLEQSQRQLKELAIRDELTGLLNRREFNRLINVEVERSIRDQSPVSLIMMDLDYFKTLNDSYGHHAGDLALQTIAKILLREIRPGDYSARFGGEEFSIILPNADIDHAQIVAERIRSATENAYIPLSEGQVIKVTASLGCASFPSHAQSEFSLLTQADRALYQAKAKGRNQIVLAQHLVSLPNYKRETLSSSSWPEQQS